MEDLHRKAVEFQSYFVHLSRLIENDVEIHKLRDFENKMFSLNSDSFEDVLGRVISCGNKKIVLQILINACSSNPQMIEQYLVFLVTINSVANEIDLSKPNETIKIFFDTLLDPFVRIYHNRYEYIEFPKNVEFN